MAIKKKAIILGLDGMRPDMLQEARAPRIKELGDEGGVFLGCPDRVGDFVGFGVDFAAHRGAHGEASGVRVRFHLAGLGFREFFPAGQRVYAGYPDDRPL